MGSDPGQFSVRFTDLFSEKANLYARARPRYPEALFAFIASKAQSLERAWDCGTGNGQAAVSLAQHFSEVCASDPSQDQIDQATRAPHVIYSVQRAERTTFPSRHFDAICVAQALHWFDFGPFFSEVNRLAKPGAIFAAWGYSWPTVDSHFDVVFESVVRRVIEPYWAPQNHLLWSGYAEVPLPFARIDTPSFEIAVSWTYREFMAYIATWSAFRKYMAETGDELVERTAAALQTVWGNPDSAREVRMPLCLLAGHVS